MVYSSIVAFCNKFIGFLPKLYPVIILFVIFFICGYLVKLLLNKVASRFDGYKKQVIRLFGSISFVLIVIIGLLTALGTIGVNVAALVASLGLSGFALGLAFKDILNNLISGLMLLFYSPFRCGDRIIVVGNEGVVVEINLRYTVLENEETTVHIPNSLMFSKEVKVLNPVPIEDLKDTTESS